MNIQEVWNKHEEEEFLKFDRVNPKRSGRPDLNAFLLLDSILPARRDIIGAAEHDEIFLDVDASELEKVITEEQIIELIRCGVRYTSEFDCLAMFV